MRIENWLVHEGGKLKIENERIARINYCCFTIVNNKTNHSLLTIH